MQERPQAKRAHTGGVHMSKNGSIWQLFVLCLLATSWTLFPGANFYYSLGHPEKPKSCQMDSCLPELCVC